MPLIFGLLVGCLAALAMTYLYFRRTKHVLWYLVAIVFVSMLPRLYYGTGPGLDDNTLYCLGWISTGAGGFMLGLKFARPKRR